MTAALLFVTALTFGTPDAHAHDATRHSHVDDATRVGAVAGGVVGVVAFVGWYGLQVADEVASGGIALHDALDVAALVGVGFVALVVMWPYVTYAAMAGGLVGGGIGAGVGALLDAIAPPE